MSSTPARRVIDCSHLIHDGLVTYPGLPAPRIGDHLTREDSVGRYAEGTTFQIGTIEMVGNTGTYLDAPFHRYAGGTDLAGLDLRTLVELPTLVVHLADVLGPERRGVVPADLTPALDAVDDVAGHAVLVDTGWSRHFGTPAYGTGAPFLSAEGAVLLAARGVAMVGIDSVNIDDVEGTGERPAHSILLEAGIHVVEHLTALADVPTTGARFTAAPPPVAGMGTFPVRAYAVVDPA